MNQREAKREALLELTRHVVFRAYKQHHVGDKNAYRRWLGYTELAEEMWRRAGMMGRPPSAKEYIDAELEWGEDNDPDAYLKELKAGRMA